MDCRTFSGNYHKNACRRAAIAVRHRSQVRWPRQMPPPAPPPPVSAAPIHPPHEGGGRKTRGDGEGRGQREHSASDVFVTLTFGRSPKISQNAKRFISPGRRPDFTARSAISLPSALRREGYWPHPSRLRRATVTRRSRGVTAGESKGAVSANTAPLSFQ